MLNSDVAAPKYYKIVTADVDDSGNVNIQGVQVKKTQGTNNAKTNFLKQLLDNLEKTVPKRRYLFFFL